MKKFLKFGVLAVVLLSLAAVSCKKEEEDMSMAYGAYVGKVNYDFIFTSNGENKQIEDKEEVEMKVEKGAKDGELVIKDADASITLTEGKEVDNGLLFNINKSDFTGKIVEDGMEVSFKANDGLKEYSLEVDGKESGKYAGAYEKASGKLMFGVNVTGEVKDAASGEKVGDITGTVRFELKKK